MDIHEPKIIKEFSKRDNDIILLDQTKLKLEDRVSVIDALHCSIFEKGPVDVTCYKKNENTLYYYFKIGKYIFMCDVNIVSETIIIYIYLPETDLVYNFANGILRRKDSNDPERVYDLLVSFIETYWANIPNK